MLFDSVSANAISQETQQFIAQHVRTVEQLEIFLTLSKRVDGSLSPREIFQQVQSNEKSISHCLEYFVKEGLAISEKEGRYRLSDQNPLLAQIASELRVAYQKRHVTVIEMIYRKPPSQVQSFADAFKIRKDK